MLRRPVVRSTWCGIRRLVALLAIVGHLLAFFGSPGYASGPGGESVSYRIRACGCASYATSRQSDCCCSTHVGEIRWAGERGIEPPPSPLDTAEHRSCCAPSHIRERTATHREKPPVPEPHCEVGKGRCRGEPSPGVVPDEPTLVADIAGAGSVRTAPESFARPGSLSVSFAFVSPPVRPPRLV